LLHVLTKPVAPTLTRHRWLAVSAIFALLGCSAVSQTSFTDLLQIRQLLPADAVLMGEQHDAPDHQRIHRVVVDALAGQNALAALALEMASQGRSTQKLDGNASEEQVRDTLNWNNEGWPWTNYGPAVMAAVRAGVPVIGANLPREKLHEAMANSRLDTLLPGPALKAQQQSVRLGHCGLLPESQISPMTRVQIARDVAMAQTLVQNARPGKTVLLLTGSGHADRTLGIAQHLPPQFMVKAVLLYSEESSEVTKDAAEFDLFWPTKPAPLVDHCANFAASLSKPAAVLAPENKP
jgi:uncharacterized iron-regulated protein